MGSVRWAQPGLRGAMAVLCVLLHTAFAWAEDAPLLTVVPFSYPPDPDYGVFLSDRIAAELMQVSYFPPLQRRRFALVESDTLSRHALTLVVGSKGTLRQDLLQEIRKRVRADYMLCGTIEPGGILRLHLRLVDLATGEVAWAGSVRDNPAWTWSRANRNIGDIPTEAVRDLLGLGAAETPPPVPAPEDLPGDILIQPFYTTGYVELAEDCRATIRQALARDATFALVSGEVGRRPAGRRLPRLNAAVRQEAYEVTLADAVVCGSLMVFGKESIIHNVDVVLRLVEVPSGRILWTQAAGGRRVWRWDKTRDLMEGMVGQLAEGVAQFGASAARTVVSALLAQAKDGAGWCAVGEAYMQRGLLSQAGEALKKALRFPDARSRAHNGLGKIYIRRSESFLQGVAAFQEAIREAPDSLDAYCNLAQAYLERDMPDGIRYAEQAIERDASCSRAYRILGNWYLAQEDDVKAATYYDSYARMEADDTETAVRFGRSLLRLQAYGQIDRVIMPIFKSHAEAVALLPVMALKSLRTEDYENAERYFERFVHQLSPQEEMLYADVRPFLERDERVWLEGLPYRERQVFEERFWRKKDPDLTTEANERLLEHYARVWVARQDFGQGVFPWDKRGDVFVRYGEPDYRSRSGRVPVLTSQKVEQVKELVYAELYRDPPSGDLVGPVFPIRSAQGMLVAQGEDAPQGSMGLLSASLDASRVGLTAAERPQGSMLEGEAYAPVTTQGDNSIVPWESWVYTDVGGGMVFDFTKETGSGGGYGFAPLPSIPPSTLKSTARLAEFSPEIAFARVVSETPDIHTMPPQTPLDEIYCDVRDFKGDSWRSRLDVAYCVPLAALTEVVSGASPLVVLERSVAVADSAYARVYRQSKTVQFSADSAGAMSHERLVVDVVSADVSPGLYHLTLKVRDAASGKSHTSQLDVRVESYAGEALAISDLMLASRAGDYAGGIRFRRGALEVVPNPRRIYTVPRMSFYYEIYNLKKNEFGQTRYRVTVGVKSVQDRQGVPAPLRADENPEVTLAYEQVGNDVWERVPLEVDLGKARKGRNRLTVTVEDLNSRNRVIKEAFFFYENAKGRAVKASP